MTTRRSARTGPTRLARRHFLTRTALAAGGVVASALATPAEPKGTRVYRAAIIGRTGGGDYGHGYDQVFKDVENVTVEAVADTDPGGLRKAAERSGARRTFADFREMLDTVRPDLVCIAPRLPDCHKSMALAALPVARGLFMEKPFTESLEDADAIVEEARRRKVKIMLAHNRRYTREFVVAKHLLAEGLIGRIRSVRIQGKQDARAGGEDMLVLGTHDFDLMRFFLGDPRWCLANIARDGRDIRGQDVQKGREPVLVAGDTIHALFGFPENIVVHWSSVKATGWKEDGKRERWAFEILGTHGIVAYQAGPGFAWLDSPYLLPADGTARWQPLPEPRQFDWPSSSRHPIRSLIHAIETDAQPLCSAEDGRWTIEMVSAVYASQRSRARVDLPLTDRRHPLTRF